MQRLEPQHYHPDCARRRGRVRHCEHHPAQPQMGWAARGGRNRTVARVAAGYDAGRGPLGDHYDNYESVGGRMMAHPS
jgi:hypothetical protein